MKKLVIAMAVALIGLSTTVSAQCFRAEGRVSTTTAVLAVTDVEAGNGLYGALEVENTDASIYMLEPCIVTRVGNNFRLTFSDGSSLRVENGGSYLVLDLGGTEFILFVEEVEC